MSIEDILVKVEQGIVKADPDSVISALNGIEMDRSKADEIFQALAKGLETARQQPMVGMTCIVSKPPTS